MFMNIFESCGASLVIWIPQCCYLTQVKHPA